MRSARTYAAVLLSLILPFFLIAQQTASTSQEPLRDPSAVAILNEVLASAGGPTAVGAIQDYSATGTATYYWAGQQTTGTLLLRGLGTTDFRLDANLPNGTQSWAVASGQGTVKSVGGTTGTIPYVDALSLAGYAFPIPQLLNFLSDTGMCITYSGQVQLNGSPAYQILVRRTFSSQLDPDGSLSQASQQTIFVDSASFHVLQVDSLAHQSGGAAASYTRSIQFSNYQVVGGVSVPFQVSETISGQQTLTIQLTSVAFNTGLTDSDFLL